MIRFYSDPDEFSGWNGNTAASITFNQTVRQRSDACNWPTYESVVGGLPNHKLFGPGNEGVSSGQGKVPYNQLKQEMR